MGADISAYTGLITSEYSDKPNFLATVAASVQPFADSMALLNSMPALFDVDAAVGQQLDFVGEWVGISRNLAVPLTGVYFSFDTAGIGFDQGIWLGPGESTTTLSALPDDEYRILLYANIAANHWDGTVNGAYEVWSIVFNSTGFLIYIQDNGNMTMDYMVAAQPADLPFTADGQPVTANGTILTLNGLSQFTPSALLKQLMSSGYFNLRPAGVQMQNYIYQTAPGPFFGFDGETPAISGFDYGAWGQYT